MTMPTFVIPYGLRDVKVAPLQANGTPGTRVDLPNAQTLEFTDSEEFTELRGDDRLVAKRGQGTRIEWSLENGGISLEAYKIMSGGTLVLSGTTPNQKRLYTKKDTDIRPYFYAEGQSIAENAGDFHVKLYRLIADDSLEGTLSDGEFWVTSASGTGLGSTDAGKLDVVYEFEHNETAVAIT